MAQIETEREIYQISIYCDVLSTIMKEYKELTITKLIFLTYLVKTDTYLKRTIFSSINTTELAPKYLSLLSGNYNSFKSSYIYIIKSIDILIKNDILFLKNKDILQINNKKTLSKTHTQLNKFTKKAIEDCIRKSDKQFMKEVLYYV